MRVMQVSERFACQVKGEHRTTLRHRPAIRWPNSMLP
jgi:hypothetical protein